MKPVYNKLPGFTGITTLLVFALIAWSEPSKSHFTAKSMLPLTVVDAKSKNVYTKYGLEFNGNCYACDLASIQFDEKHISLLNVCDAQQKMVFEITSSQKKGNDIEIICKNGRFIFTRVDKAPVYELKLIKITSKENFRIAKYYAPKELLKKFKQHDCGDFEG